MLTKFRNLYPQGSILSELIDIDRGIYIVRVSIQIDGLTLATGLAGADTVEKAEDNARNRALQTLLLEDGHLSLNLAAKATNKVTTVSPATASETTPKINTAPETNHQVKVTTTAVQPPVTQPPVTTSLISETSTAKIPQPEPEVIASPPQPETTIPALPDYQEEMIETPLEQTSEPISDREILAATEEDFAVPEETPITTTPVTETPVEFDFNQIRHKIDLEMKRLKWTKEQGRDYLLSTYGKRSRLHLTDDELLEFWHYLETLPN